MVQNEGSDDLCPALWTAERAKLRRAMDKSVRRFAASVLKVDIVI